MSISVVMATAAVIANLKWLIFQNKRNSAQSMLVTNSKPHGPVAKMSKKMRINKRVIVFSLEFDF